MSKKGHVKKDKKHSQSHHKSHEKDNIRKTSEVIKSETQKVSLNMFILGSLLTIIVIAIIIFFIYSTMSLK